MRRSKKKMKVSQKAEKAKERFKREFPNELLEFYFESRLGKNEHNGLPWRVLLEDKIEPHMEILCDISQWLIERGWDREIVKELFFVVADKDK